MNSKREIGELIESLDISKTLRHMKLKDWQSWILLPETKTFINLLNERKVTHALDTISKSLDSQMNIALCSENKGRCDEIDEILQNIEYLTNEGDIYEESLKSDG